MKINATFDYKRINKCVDRYLNDKKINETFHEKKN